MWAGLAGTFGFSRGLEGRVEVRVFWETGLSPGLSPVRDCLEELEAEEMLVSSSPLVRVPVIVTSDSDIKLDS